jgi:carboxymethylenebutenolidase
MTTTNATITLDTADGPMPVFTAAPDGEPRGAVVVVQEAFGVTTHIEGVATRLADAGYRALAPALFHRQGSPVLAYGDLDAVMPLMSQLKAEGIAADLAACFDHLDATGFPGARTGIVGFCMGGTVAFFAATLRPLGAAVTFYGGGVTNGRFGFPSLVELAPSLQAPWLGLYGDLDQGIAVADVEQLRDALLGAPVSTDLVRYAEAGHGFNCNDRPESFNPDAAADGWARTLAWFGEHLGG